MDGILITVLGGLALASAVFLALSASPATQHAYLDWIFWPVAAAPFLVFFLVLKFIVEFFPSVLIAGLVWWFTGGDLFMTIVAFLASAVVFAIVGHYRRRSAGGPPFAR